MMRRLHGGTPRLYLVLILLALVASCAGSGSAAQSTPSPVAPTATAARPSTAPPPPSAAPVDPARAANPAPGPTTLVIGNTGGLGAFIRRTPGGEMIRAWPDGTGMVVIGQDVEAAGRVWKKTRDPDGNEGWVAGEYLVER